MSAGEAGKAVTGIIMCGALGWLTIWLLWSWATLKPASQFFTVEQEQDATRGQAAYAPQWPRSISQHIAETEADEHATECFL